jgi:hypothetical protein
MDGYLSNKPENFVDDLEILNSLRRHEAQAKKLEFAYPKEKAEGSSESPKESPPPSPRENQLSTATDGRTTAAGVQAIHPEHR